MLKAVPLRPFHARKLLQELDKWKHIQRLEQTAQSQEDQASPDTEERRAKRRATMQDSHGAPQIDCIIDKSAGE